MFVNGFSYCLPKAISIPPPYIIVLTIYFIMNRLVCYLKNKKTLQRVTSGPQITDVKVDT